MDSFDRGDLVRLGNSTGTNDDGTTRAAFTNVAGVATDPTAVTLTLKLPDGTFKYYGYTPAGADGTLTRESAGRFYYDYTIAAAGTYYWTLAGTGAVVTSEEGAFFCRSSALTAPTSYASVEQFKDAIEIADADTVSDAGLQRALVSATEWIDGYCGRVFGPLLASATRTFVAQDSGRLMIPDVAAVTAVTIDNAGDGTFGTSLAATQYQLHPLDIGLPGVRGNYREIRIRSHASQSFWPGVQVRVTGTFGYGSIPYSVEQACILLANRYFRRPAAPFGVIQAPETGEIARLPQNDPDVKQLLKDFRVSSQDWVAV